MTRSDRTVLSRARSAALVSLFVAVFVSGSASAVTLASWATFGEPGDQAFTAGTGAANVTATNLQRGADLGATTGSNSLNSNGWGSTDPGDYIELGLDIAAGFQATLDELLIGTRSSNTGPGTIGVYTSLDGFASPVSTLVQPGASFLNSVVDLSSLGVVTGSVLIRLIEIGNTQADGVGTTSNGGTFRVNSYFDGSNFLDTQINGSIALVPEPGTALLVGLGLAGLTFAGRRRA